MTESLVALGAFLLAGATAAGLTRRETARLTVENWSGRRVPVVLGIALLVGIVGAFLLAIGLEGNPASSGVGLAGAAALAVMFSVGLLDDVRGSKARGLREHISHLGRLRLTTGIAKLIMGVGLGIWLAVLGGGPLWRILVAAVLITVSTNVANALDVRPGRALKLTLPFLLLAWLAAQDPSVSWLAAAGVGAGLAVLPFDLAERGMLGDAGSNPLGLLSGLGLAATLPTWGMLTSVAIVLLIQVAAETVTISRLIDAVPPLRWYDRLGRRN